MTVESKQRTVYKIVYRERRQQTVESRWQRVDSRQQTVNNRQYIEYSRHEEIVDNR